jgi:plastocyanin
MISAHPVAHTAATKNVAVHDDYYAAKAITVKKGATVKWTWKDKGKHDVAVSKGPAIFRSSVKRKGTFSHKMTKRGSYTLVCTVHAPDMKMTIKVK